MGLAVRRVIGSLLAPNLVEFSMGQWLIRKQTADASAIPEPIVFARFLEARLCPRLETSVAKLFEGRDRFLLANSNLALCERNAVRGFHLARNFVVALFRGFANRLTVPHELVPVDFSALIDHRYFSFRAALLRGRPPFLPFSRDDAAFRFEVTAPRHAGQ